MLLINDGYMKKKVFGCNVTCMFILICIGIALPVKSQNNYKVKLTGTVYEYGHNNRRLPLEFAAVSIPEIALGTTSNENGRYTLENVPTGKIRMQIQYLGKVSIDTLINVSKDLVLNFTMRNEDFIADKIINDCLSEHIANVVGDMLDFQSFT